VFQVTRSVVRFRPSRHSAVTAFVFALAVACTTPAFAQSAKAPDGAVAYAPARELLGARADATPSEAREASPAITPADDASDKLWGGVVAVLCFLLSGTLLVVSFLRHRAARPKNEPTRRASTWRAHRVIDIDSGGVVDLRDRSPAVDARWREHEERERPVRREMPATRAVRMAEVIDVTLPPTVSDTDVGDREAPAAIEPAQAAEIAEVTSAEQVARETVDVAPANAECMAPEVVDVAPADVEPLAHEIVDVAPAEAGPVADEVADVASADTESVGHEIVDVDAAAAEPATHDIAHVAPVELVAAPAAPEMSAEQVTGDDLAAAGALVDAADADARVAIAGVVGLADLMLREGGLSRRTLDHLRLLHSSADPAQAALDDIRDLAAIRLGKAPLAPVVFDPSRLLEEVVAEWRAEAAAKGVEIALDVGVLPRRVIADRRRLRKVVEHMLRAVVQGTAATRVRVEADARAPGERMRVAVRDNRPGPGPVDSSAAGSVREVANTIARGLVAAMGGKYRTRVTSAGHTLCRMVIPCATARDEEHAAPPVAQPSSRLRGAAPREVLVIDEAPLERELMRTLLAARGHRPHACARIDDGVEFLGANALDVVVMAVRAFDAATRAALVRLRAAAGDHTVAIVAVAACADPGPARWRGIGELGDAADDFDAVLEAPLDWDQLDDLLAEVGGRAETEALIDAHMMGVIKARLGGDAGPRRAVEFVIALGALVRSARESHAADDRLELHETLETLGGLAATFGCLPVVAAVRASRSDSPTTRLARVLAAISEVFPKLRTGVPVAETETA
jgi:CheY-like chemotaxis protein